MNTFFKGKKLLVVGGTSGMGLAVARMVLEAGGSVVLTGNKKDKADRKAHRDAWAESMTIFETQNDKAQQEIESLVKEVIL